MPSPLPTEIVEFPVIEVLIADSEAVICVGGGGLPLLRDEKGHLHGIEAAIDKDRAAARLAEALQADALLLLTDVKAVEIDFGTPSAREIRETSVAELRALNLPDGSMWPKVTAACDFAEATDHLAAIGRLQDAEALLSGSSGTVVGALPSS